MEEGHANEGRDQRNAPTSQRIPRISRNRQKLERGKEVFPRVFGRRMVMLTTVFQTSSPEL